MHTESRSQSMDVGELAAGLGVAESALKLLLVVLAGSSFSLSSS